MYPQQYPAVSSAPPPYTSDMQSNNQQYRESTTSYRTSSEDRMAGFQQLVDRYESKHFTYIKLHIIR